MTDVSIMSNDDWRCVSFGNDRVRQCDVSV